MMNNIPRKILDMILEHLPEYEYPVTERFWALTPESKQGILSARTVWAGFRLQQPLRGLFVRVLEESSFGIWKSKTDSFYLPGLEELSRSEYAKDITTFSLLCAGDGDPEELITLTTTEDAETVVKSSFRRLSNIKNVRFLTVKKMDVKGV